MKTEVEPFPNETILKLCAENWGLSELHFVRKMENIVFRGARGKQSYYLRLTTPLRRSREQIEAELDWVEYLRKQGLTVVDLLPDCEGRRLFSIDQDGFRYEAAVFVEMPGKHPDERKAKSPQFLKALGSKIARMHLASEKYEREHPVHRREEWHNERGIRHALESAEASTNTAMCEKFEQSLALLKGYNTTASQYGLVHTDLGAENLFVQGNENIGIIDFDDSCYHWYAFDLAIVLYSMANRFDLLGESSDEPAWLSQLLQGYLKHRHLSEQEISKIPIFMDFACLRLYFWIEHHESLGTFREESLEKVTEMKHWAEKRVLYRSCFNIPKQIEESA